MAPPGGQIFNLSKWHYLVAKFPTMQIASGTTWWQNFQLKEVALPGGQISNLGKWSQLVAKFRTSGTSVFLMIVYNLLCFCIISNQ